MELEATMLTFEDSPITVSPSDIPTSGAFLGGIPGIQKGNGNTKRLGLVFDEVLEHSKPPAVELAVSLLTEIGSTPDMGEFFKDDNGTIQCSCMAY